MDLIKKSKFGVIAIAILLTAFLISAFFQSEKENKVEKKAAKTEVVYNTLKIENRIQEKIISTSGRMYAYESIAIFAEVGGILDNSSIRFKEGMKFKKGDELVKIDDSVYKNSLLSAKSNLLNQITVLLPDLKYDFPDEYKKWEKYLSGFQLNSELQDLPKFNSDREKFYLASNNIFKLFYDIKSMEATYNKYTIEAPFDGVVTESNIKPGNLVRVGQKLGTFISPDKFELKAAIKLDDVKRIKLGMNVDLISVVDDKIVKGKIARINESIDQQTQTLSVYIQSSDSRIKDGMFFNVEIITNSNEKLAKLPKAVVKNNSVNILSDGEKTQIEISIADKDDSFFYIKGLQNGVDVIIPSAIQ